MVMGGWSALSRVFPAAVLCGVTFAGLQFTISNFVGPQLTDLIASLGALGVLVVLFMFWKPKDSQKYELSAAAKAAETSEHSVGQVFLAWSPYFLLVICVLLWGWPPMVAKLNSVSIPIQWPGLHNLIARVPPVTAKVSPYAAVFNLNWLSASGTSCMIACILSCFVLRVPPLQAIKIFLSTMRQLTFSLITLACVLGLAYLMNYSGRHRNAGPRVRRLSPARPFRSSAPSSAGWVSSSPVPDTSANALFGNLQVVTASKLGFNPVLMASANSAGGVMGKMIQPVEHCSSGSGHQHGAG